MFAAFGRARKASSVTFVSEAGLSAGLEVEKPLVAVRNTRGGIGKASMIHNAYTPRIEVDPETYEVRADGELLTCEPAEVLADGAEVLPVLSTLDRATPSRTPATGRRHEARDRVTLDFDRRHRRRLRLATDAGAELLLDLPKAAALAAGDGLRTEGGRVDRGARRARSRCSR